MDFLKRELAPITDLAWGHIEDEARRVLSARLSARRVISVAGPKGFDFSAVNLGGVVASEEAPQEGLVRFGIRRVLPLVEARIDFQLAVATLDDLSRGASDADFAPLVEACARLASFEETLVYRGLPEAGVLGIGTSREHAPIPLSPDPAGYPDAVARAMIQLAKRGIDGPFALVLGEVAYRRLASELSPTPPRERIAKMIKGPVLYSTAIDDGLLLAPGDHAFELTLGQDASIGYASHDATSVTLYLLETLTFRMTKPEAIVRLPNDTR